MNETKNIPKNVVELRDQLCVVFARAQQDSSFLPMAHEATNTAGKIIKSISVELEYQHHLGQKSTIKFMQI
jgi:hypothetical protein